MPEPEKLAEPTEPAAPDDLKIIEGIGPKIAGLLQAADIMTFAQLAATDVGRLQEILETAGLTRLADPTTWPEQAQLAAVGQWTELETLQGNLKGGRRVS
jgi:predicted flap endonuclease-1-like 5' DNA nuclease